MKTGMLLRTLRVPIRLVGAGLVLVAVVGGQVALLNNELPAKTRLTAVLLQRLDSDHARPGDVVEFSVPYDVIVGDRALIPRGSRLEAEVQETRGPALLHGDAGVVLQFQRVILANDRVIPMRGRVIGAPGLEAVKVDLRTGALVQDDHVRRGLQHTAQRAGALAAGFGVFGLIIGHHAGTMARVGASLGSALATHAIVSHQWSSLRLYPGDQITVQVETLLKVGPLP